MSLEVTIEKATNVPNAETFGKSDPYVSVEFQGLSRKTDVKKGELNPVWNETLNFDLKGCALVYSDVLVIQVKDWELVGRNRLLGAKTVPLKDLARPGAAKTQQLKLRLEDGNKRETMCELNVIIVYTAPPGSEADQDMAAAGEEMLGADPEATAAEVSGDPASPAAPGQPAKKKARKQMVVVGGNRKVELSSRTVDLQIRVKVVEGRQLPGNPSAVVRVSCAGQRAQTRVGKSSSSPFYDQVFYFSLKMSPAELLEQYLTLSVFNSRRLRSDALIGSFKCDLAFVYTSPRHSLVHKWLLLSDPDDALAGARGYLKICASVLGPGDQPVSFKVSGDTDSHDIEANLLRPVGVQLQPATFVLKVYQAQDIPRMDSDFMEGVKKIFTSGEKKELVDPYFVFRFAGRKVKTKIMYNSDHPEWNQELRLGLRFPSMCEKLQFQLFDWVFANIWTMFCEFLWFTERI